MDRLLSEIAGYLRDLRRTSLGAWRTFFFAPADPTALGLMRVAVGALLLWNVAVLGPDLYDYLGSDGWIGPEALRAYLAQHSPWAWSFWIWVPDRWLPIAWAACLVALALYTVGLWSRVTAALAWAIAVSLIRRAPVALFGFDHMISTWALYLAAFGASGQAVSLDRFLARLRAIKRAQARPGQRRPGQTRELSGVPAASVTANLSLRMLQLHLVLIYGSAGLSKLMGPEWWDGTAMQMIILTPEFRRFDLTWAFAYPGLLSLATHGGLLLELSYPVLIWIPKLRPVLLASVVLLHAGIDLTLGLTEFGLAMIAANLAFVSGPWLRRLVTGDLQPAGCLRFAHGSPRGQTLATLALAADPDRVLLVDDTDRSTSAAPPLGVRDSARDQTFALVGADGRTSSGYDAMLTVARWLPLFWPVALLGRLPGLRTIFRGLFLRLTRDTALHRTSGRINGGRSPRAGLEQPLDLVGSPPTR